MMPFQLFETAMGTPTEFFADLQQRLANVTNETEVRDAFCGELRAHFNITLRLERGRSDARRNRVVMEFKDKGLFKGKRWQRHFPEGVFAINQEVHPRTGWNRASCRARLHRDRYRRHALCVCLLRRERNPQAYRTSAILRQAKLDMIRNFGRNATPYLWGGFVVVGDSAVKLAAGL